MMYISCHVLEYTLLSQGRGLFLDLLYSFTYQETLSYSALSQSLPVGDLHDVRLTKHRPESGSVYTLDGSLYFQTSPVTS